MSVAERVAFFLKCQELLLSYHTTSPFLFTQTNAKERLSHAKSLNEQYKGLCYQDENICILYNKVHVEDEKDPVQALKIHKFKEPVQSYNAYSIDFVVFRRLMDCAIWIKNNYEPKIQFVLYVKNGKPQIYKTAPFIARLMKLPIASH